MRKICFINPAFPESLWSLRTVTSLLGKKAPFAPLGLATIAACTPSDFEIEIYDEEVESINFATDADIVAITAFNVQAARAFDIAREFRRRGKLVCMGGAYASLCPEKCAPHVDVLFEGEGEHIWGKFLTDYKESTHANHYKQDQKISMLSSPSPRYELLKVEDYLAFPVQTSRGCPFTCEFCDIIVTDGRIPRTKSVEQVLAEIQRLYRLGVGEVLFTDANFIGNPKYALELVEALRSFGEKRGFPIRFACEATINLATKEGLLSSMQEANFDRVFVGIESPRISSLVETKKLVNTRRSLVDSIRKIQSYGIHVGAGMIVGFDSDDKGIFQEQFDFLTEAGIPITTVGTLVALDKTPLYQRLEREGRLVASEYVNLKGHGASDTNFIPKQMTLKELQDGYNWLIRSLYAYDNYSTRVLRCMNSFPKSSNWCKELTKRGRGARAFVNANGIRSLLGLLKILTKVLPYSLLGAREVRRFFVSTILGTLRGGATFQRLVAAGTLLVFHKHFHDYVSRAHGNPESASHLSPYSAPGR